MMAVARHWAMGLLASTLTAGALAAQSDTTRTDSDPVRTTGVQIETANPNPRAFVELRGNFNVPTFDIHDRIESGAGGGFGLGFQLAPRVWLLGDADVGFHDGQGLVGGLPAPDINIYHFMGKIGFDIMEPGATPWSVMINGGAGAMLFDRKGPAGLDKSYFAINVGLKIAYALAQNISFVLSPQGNIAFTDEAVVGTSNAWVWPFSAGFRLQF